MRIPGFMHPPWDDDAIRAFPKSDDGASQMNGPVMMRARKSLLTLMTILCTTAASAAPPASVPALLDRLTWGTNEPSLALAGRSPDRWPKPLGYGNSSRAFS